MFKNFIDWQQLLSILYSINLHCVVMGPSNIIIWFISHDSIQTVFLIFIWLMGPVTRLIWWILACKQLWDWNTPQLYWIVLVLCCTYNNRHRWIYLVFTWLCIIEQNNWLCWDMLFNGMMKQNQGAISDTQNFLNINAMYL